MELVQSPSAAATIARLAAARGSCSLVLGTERAGGESRADSLATIRRQLGDVTAVALIIKAGMRGRPALTALVRTGISDVVLEHVEQTWSALTGESEGRKVGQSEVDRRVVLSDPPHPGFEKESTPSRIVAALSDALAARVRWQCEYSAFATRRDYHIDTFSALFECRRTSLTRIFASTVGLSPSVWLRTLRVVHALESLPRHPNLDSLAAELEFSAGSHVSRLIRAYERELGTGLRDGDGPAKLLEYNPSPHFDKESPRSRWRR